MLGTGDQAGLIERRRPPAARDPDPPVPADRLTWDQLFTDALELALDEGCWSRAQMRAIDLSKRGQVDRRTNKFWTGIELCAHGMICEAAFGAWAGLPVRWELASHGLTGLPDVGRYEIKSSAWYSVKSFVDWHGGATWIPDHTRSQIVVLMTVFRQTRELRVYLDGWLSMNDVRARPSVAGKGGTGRSWRVPYGELQSWRTLPVLT